MSSHLEAICSAAYGETERNAFSTLWRIHFTKDNHEINAVESPEFKVDFMNETCWKLGIFLNDGHYSLYLSRNDKGPEILTVDFELSLLTLGNLPLSSKIRKTFRFARGGHYVFEHFLKRLDVRKNMHLCLPCDCLTVRFRMWPDYKLTHPVQCFISTVFVKERVSFLWSVHWILFPALVSRMSYTFSSPSQGNIVLNMRLLWDNALKRINYANILLGPLNMKQLGRLVCKISVMDIHGKLRLTSANECPRNLWFGPIFDWVFPFPQKDTMNSMWDSLAINNVLTLRWEFEFWWSRVDEFDLSQHRPWQTLANFISPFNDSATNSTQNLAPSDDFPKSIADYSTSEDSHGEFDSQHGHFEIKKSASVQKGSAIGNTNIRFGDSTVGDTSAGLEDSVIRESTIGLEDCVAGDTTAWLEDSDLGDGTAEMENYSIINRTAWLEDSAIGDTTARLEDSAISDITAGLEDSAIGDATAGFEDSAFRDANVGLEDSAFRDANVGLEDSAIGDTTIGLEDSTVGDTAAGLEDSAIGDSIVGIEDNDFGDIAEGLENSAPDDTTMWLKDSNEEVSTLISGFQR